MKSGRKPAPILTEKELVIMKMLWENGPMHVRDMLPLYPEPRPHFNTVSTFVRILEEKGRVGHEVIGGSHRYYAITPKEDIRDRSFTQLVADFFNKSYKNAVSALVEEEKISVDELRDIIRMIEEKNKE